MAAVTGLLTVAVVYCRYHYVLDAGARVVTALLAVAPARYLTGRDEAARDVSGDRAPRRIPPMRTG
ncbi:hypothetical protein [Streptomyces kanasensis]|uniref:hypothetical protein n=1 Tax=Streptomyces kanasensis TaxID=936756 RepID=UPI00382C78E8